MCDKHPDSKKYKNGSCAECARARQQAYHKRNKDKARACRRARTFGLTKEQAALVDAWPTCNICGVLLKAGSQGATKRCIDHDHDTGVIRGILCFNCNLALGSFRDNPDLLLRAAEYLTKPETRMRVANFT